MEDILGTAVPEVRAADRVMDPRVAFIISSFLNDAIQRGTGRRARVLDRQDISGKTGTTNGPRDAWFSGFNRDLITTAWVGFDDYGPLGRREFGAPPTAHLDRLHAPGTASCATGTTHAARHCPAACRSGIRPAGAGTT